MTQLFANNAESTLASGITNVATSMTVASGEGSKFPSPTGGDFFLLTLFNVVSGNEQGWEIVKVTARSSDTLTIVRAQDGTGASAFSSGAYCSLRINSGTAADWTSRGAIGGQNDRVFFINSQNITADYTVATGTNAGTFGPVTIANGVTVTIANGSTWSIV